ncbi:MAG TPA: HD domain-containing phosphohydrolase [Fibrobacteraceae bacterium]|nr:HD domain-containing phosphohydrolase [Fibrobacteraceae bacterium]
MKQGTILIVDDDPENLAILDQILGDEYPVVTASSGRGALEAVAKHKPALILLDVRMPDMDGLTVCTQLKANKETESIPVLFVTALDEVCDEAAGFAAGAVDYLVKPVSPSIVRARIRTHLSLTRVETLERSYREAVYMLGEAGHHNDNDTGLHIWRMAAYASLLAHYWGWDSEQCHSIELAAPMHDTGKLGIPDRILRKPGPLDSNEWLVMKTHSKIGHNILSKSLAPVFQMAADIALHHHEKWDGGGYPDGIAGPDIEESARLVAIADVFDALSMRRPYKEPWSMIKILETISFGAGHHFDPQMVECFFDILPKIKEIKECWDHQEQHKTFSYEQSRSAEIGLHGRSQTDLFSFPNAAL